MQQGGATAIVPHRGRDAPARGGGAVIGAGQDGRRHVVKVPVPLSGPAPWEWPPAPTGCQDGGSQVRRGRGLPSRTPAPSGPGASRPCSEEVAGDVLVTGRERVGTPPIPLSRTGRAPGRHVSPPGSHAPMGGMSGSERAGILAGRRVGRMAARKPNRTERREPPRAPGVPSLLGPTPHRRAAEATGNLR